MTSSIALYYAGKRVGVSVTDAHTVYLSRGLGRDFTFDIVGRRFRFHLSIQRGRVRTGANLAWSALRGESIAGRALRSLQASRLGGAADGRQTAGASASRLLRPRVRR